MNTATNAVVEGQMAQVSKTTAPQQTVITGQYLYDNFVVSSQEQVTRMTMIRKWALVDNVSEEQLKEAFKSLIEKAKEVDTANGVTEGRGPKVQQAMNVRTIVQNSIGALRRAPKQLAALGYNETKTGYIEMGALASKALKSAGIKWNGKALPTDEAKAAAEEKARTEAKTAAFAQAMATTARLEGETNVDFYARVEHIANEVIAKSDVEQKERVLSAKTQRVIKLLGNVDLIEQVAQRLLAQVQAFRDAQASGAIDQEETDLNSGDETEGMPEQQAA